MEIPPYTHCPPRARKARRSRALGPTALGAVLLGAAVGCGGPSGIEDSATDRETFIAVYVDLRVAAMDNRGQEIHPAERDSILAVYGVEADALVAFADSHGRDIPYMTELWTEIEELIYQAIKPELQPPTERADSVGDGP